MDHNFTSLLLFEIHKIGKECEQIAGEASCNKGILPSFKRYFICQSTNVFFFSTNREKERCIRGSALPLAMNEWREFQDDVAGSAGSDREEIVPILAFALITLQANSRETPRSHVFGHIVQSGIIVKLAFESTRLRRRLIREALNMQASSGTTGFRLFWRAIGGVLKRCA